MMNFRTKLSIFIVVLSLLGVFSTGFFILQSAAQDKKNYVTELNSVLGPQIKNSSDEKLSNLLNELNEFTEWLNRNSDVKSESSKKYTAEILSRKLKGVEAVFVKTSAHKLISVAVDPANVNSAKIAEVADVLQKTDLKIQTGDQFYFFHDRLFLFKTSFNETAAVLMADEVLNESFDLARGKISFIINSAGQSFFGSKNELRQFDLQNKINPSTLNSADLFAQEIQDNSGKNYLAYFNRLKKINDAYVLILSPQPTWFDLITPLFKSSLSLIAFLIYISIMLSFYLSRSLAKPIEELSEKVLRVGQGEWQTVQMGRSDVEINKLKSSFNHMIKNLKKRESELKEANQKLIQSESLAAVGRMSSGIAHEVKNPLASVLGYAQLIDINIKNAENSGAPQPQLEKIKNYNKLIMDDTRRASKIITDLLTFARQKKVESEIVKVNDFISQISPKLLSYAEAHSVKLQIETSDLPDDSFFKIDADQIYQVLFNFVQNSVHALSEKQDKRINVAVRRTSNQIELTVSDNGPGMPPENISKIFEPFFTTKKIGEGTGLGLAICYGIVSQHEGQIEVRSEPDVQTSFIVKLPLQNQTQSA
ncbi:MAG: HAMP domain-containing sensor histidine kinase [Pseudobdellovibrio sp.]